MTQPVCGPCPDHFSSGFCGRSIRQGLACLVITGVLGMVLTGCGRRGALELPASAMVENEKGDMVRKPAADKPFMLDPLIK